MIDFTSALYLGLQHAREALQPWRELTTGVPAALDEPVAAREIAVRLARLQGFAAAALAPSTLHLAWDVFGLLSHERITVHMDAGAYSISHWGAARAMLRGVRVREFRHHDVQALHAHMENDESATRPVVVTDGFCPACGRAAPLADYLAEARARGGWLVVDDTQALGILGRLSPLADSPDGAPNRSRNRSSFSRVWEKEKENEERERFPAGRFAQVSAYGSGGGGSFQWRNLHGPGLIAIASLAKAFGVPVAVVAGSAGWIDEFKARSSTRVHCSPPSVAHLNAAVHALDCNLTSGNERRSVLEQRVRQFRRGLRARGILSSGGLFPVQTLAMPDSLSTLRFHDRLRQRGVNAVPTRGHDRRPRLSFLITARHRADEIEEAVGIVAAVTASIDEKPMQLAQEEYRERTETDPDSTAVCPRYSACKIIHPKNQESS